MTAWTTFEGECTACGPEDYGPCICTEYCGSICCTVLTGRPVHNHLPGEPELGCPACGTEGEES